MRRDRATARLAAQERLGELHGLLVLDLARQRRLVRVHVHVDQGRAIVAERLADRVPDLTRVGHLEAQRTVGRRDAGVVRERIRIPDAVLGVAQHHLLPQDLAEGVVVVDHDLDRQLVLDGGDELGHQHGEPAVADVARSPGGRGRHAGSRSRTAARAPSWPGSRTGRTAGRRGCPVPRGPGRDGPAVAGQDGVVGGQLVEHADQELRRDRAPARRPAARPSAPATRPSALVLLQERGVGPLLEQRQQGLQAPPGRRRPPAPRSGPGRRPGPGQPRSGRSAPCPAPAGTWCTGSSCRP